MKKICLIIFFAVMLCVFSGCSKKPSQDSNVPANGTDQAVITDSNGNIIDINSIDDSRLQRAVEKTLSSDGERRSRED